MNGTSDRKDSPESSGRDRPIDGSRLGQGRWTSSRLVLSVLLCAGVAAGASAPVGGHIDAGWLSAGNYLCPVDLSLKRPPAAR